MIPEVTSGVVKHAVKQDPRRSPGFIDGSALVPHLLRLCLGDCSSPPFSGSDWKNIYELASRERCAGLAWLRSGDFIREHAPSTVVDQWRMTVVRQYEDGANLLSIGTRELSRLSERGIKAIVVKGAPLASRLYGDPLVRPLDDLDVVVAPESWEATAELLIEMGWEKDFGRRGWAEIYRIRHEGRVYQLDLQAGMLVDHLYHLPEPSVTVGEWSWNGVPLSTLVGAGVAVLLAVHLLKHQLPPLLWLIDFQTLWAGMSADERAMARHIARESRVHRYLEWAIDRASALSEASLGSTRAMRALGFGTQSRRDTYGMLRLALLAGSPRDAVAVLGAWAWPRPLRYDWDSFRAMWLRRARKSVPRLLTAERAYLDARDRSDLAPSVKESHHGLASAASRDAAVRSRGA